MRALTRVKKVGLTLLKSRVRPLLRGANRVKKMAEHGRNWTDAEIRALLAIWSDKTMQRQLLGTTRNTAVFRTMSERLQQ